jgi:lipid A 3-O-deacylase
MAAAGAGAQEQTANTSQRGDPTSIWTIQGENASISTSSLTDRYYVNGLRLGWTSGTDVAPGFLDSAANVLWGDGETRIAFDLSQQIFTPKDTAVFDPPPDDRPYAGILLGNFQVFHDTEDSRSHFGVALGVIGPSALAQSVQNGFHQIIGQSKTNGWNYQLKDEPAIEITTGRTWRLPITSFGAVEVDALPELQGGLGNVRIFGEGGAVIRIGQGLASDYGVARVIPGNSGGDAFKPTRPFVWYVFAGADGQAVAQDVTLNGNTFQSSRSVPLTPLVGEIEAGLAMIFYGARLTYTQVFQTQEFQHQKGGLHQFGSLALSVRF